MAAFRLMAMYLEAMPVDTKGMIMYKFIKALIYIFTGLNIFTNSNPSLCSSPHLGCHQNWEDLYALRVPLSSVGNLPEILPRVRSDVGFVTRNSYKNTPKKHGI